ncbi:MAG: hypothetical protein ALAOOOJD_01535 [bacterium]|nr:hypothetical protein [bacterium]
MNTIKPMCHDFAALLSLFAAGELTAKQSASVAAHLSACAACRQKVAAYEQLSAHLTKLAPPTLPEGFFDDFHAGVKKKIASVEGAQQQQQQMAGWLVMVHALYRRRRLAIAIVTLLLLLSIPTWLTHDRRFMAPPPSNLTQLLEQRDWMGLYYAMRNSELRTSLLNEPVPVQLLHTALAELLKAQHQDPKIRLGLQQVLAKIKTREGISLGLGRSAQILGAITATGYATAIPSRQIVWNPEMSLLALTQVDANKTMTIHQLLLTTNLEGNKL